jgi:hypothetical protein
MPKFIVYQYGEWNGERIAYEYPYAIEAETADEAVELIVEDRDLITDDFLDAPNGVAWIGEGYAEQVEEWATTS